MAKRAKASEPSESSEPDREVGIVKVDEPLADAPVEVEPKPEPPPAPPSLPPKAPPRTPTGPSFGDRVGGFFRFLLRLVSLLILLSLLSLVLYLVIPWFYQNFIRPVEQTSAQVTELQSKQEQMEQDLADLQTKLGTLETVQNQHDGSINQSGQRLISIETEIAGRTQSLTALETKQSDLQARDETNSAELERQIDLLKSMELLSRARLSLYQSNFGLARADLQIARDLLATIQPDAPDSLAAELEAVIQRLDLALSNLPDFPVAASDDLDIAWQILLSGLPEATPTVSGTPSPAGTLSVTPSPSVTLTPTSTLKVTVSPSPTP